MSQPQQEPALPLGKIEQLTQLHQLTVEDKESSDHD